MTLVDVGEVQANVLYGYGFAYDHALYLRLNVDRAKRAREAIARWNALISFSEGRKRKVRAHVNVAFTARGLCRLEIPQELLDAFPKDYRRGARRRAKRLGDTWCNDGSSAYEDCDVLLSIVGLTPPDCLALKQEIDLAPFTEVGELRAAAERKKTASRDRDELVHERFGFADGRSQPAIEGVDPDPVGDGVYAGEHPTSGWAPPQAEHDGRGVRPQADRPLLAADPRRRVPARLRERGRRAARRTPVAAGAERDVHGLPRDRPIPQPPSTTTSPKPPRRPA